MGDDGRDISATIAGLLAAGVISVESAMRMVGRHVDKLPPRFDVGAVIQFNNLGAVVTGYDPHSGRVDLFTSEGEAVTVSESSLFGQSATPIVAVPAAAVPDLVKRVRVALTHTPPPVAAPLPTVTVTRERAIMLD